MAPKKGPSSGISPVLTLVLVITAFFAGRFITLPGELPQPGQGVSILEGVRSAPPAPLLVAAVARWCRQPVSTPSPTLKVASPFPCHRSPQ